jgi:hypothetical protein
MYRKDLGQAIALRLSNSLLQYKLRSPLYVENFGRVIALGITSILQTMTWCENELAFL